MQEDHCALVPLRCKTLKRFLAKIRKKNLPSPPTVFTLLQQFPPPSANSAYTVPLSATNSSKFRITSINSEIETKKWSCFSNLR